MRSLFCHQTAAERENRKRIKLCVYAFAYEFENTSLVPDAQFDEMARSVDLSIVTKHQEWWRKEFNPSTGQWIHTHPNLQGIRSLYATHYDS